MADAIFEVRRLAEIYDPLDPDRGDLDVYVTLSEELASRSVLDIGCGTGTLACLLAERGVDVTALDPAAASLDVARTKAHADRVKWILGDAAALPSLQVDLVTMTGNVAQVFLTEEEWSSTLKAAASVLRPGGHLVFETRDPAREGWQEWSRQQTYRRVVLPDVGEIETWIDLKEVTLPFVTFRWTFVFVSDGTRSTSDSTLRFWERDEITNSLVHEGFTIDDIRDAPDRPGRELVFIARRQPGRF
jgi:2-polyprenyl-3-methyl-5-hydroxy-6-metoxy-1,4-benzoquinol methylase